MSSTMDTRALILAAFDAADLNAATTGQFAAPCILVEPGDPWTVPQHLPRRLVRWRLTAVAGRADSEGALESLGELVEKVDTALNTVPGVQLPGWGRPFDAALDGIPYAASVATVQLLAEA